MDEELEQRGVTAKTFFDQATETREMVQAVKKTSNSNLSLLNELKEKVRKIEVKLFDEEDKRQKEEMEAKVKEQNEKSQGSGGGSKEGGEEGGGTKGGGGGGVMGFISSFIGGLVGGTVGLAVQGAGAIIGLGTGIIKKGADLGKSLKKGFSNLFGGKKNENGGEEKPKVNANSLMDLKVEDKNVRGTGAKNRGREGGNFSGDQQRNERGEYASKNKNEVVKEESFSIPQGKKTSFADALSGDRDTIHQFLFEQRVASVPPGEGFSDFSGNPAYDRDVDTFLRGLKDNPKGIGIEINRGRVFLSKDKAVDGGYTFGRDTKYEGVKSDNEMYGDTFPKRSFSGSKKNTYERAILEFNEGGVVQKFNQGGEVDTVPAMLTPGEFVVSKDAVKKVGVDTLKGLNASVGATNKPTYTMGYRRGEITPDQLVVTSTKFMDQKTQKRMGGQGGRALGSTTKRQGGDTFESKSLFGENYAGISRRTTTSSLDYIPGGDGVRDSNLKTKKTMEKDMVSVAVEDIMEHQDDLLKRIRRVKGYENVTIEDVLNSRVDMDKQKYARIIGHSDAAKATQKKKDEARKADKEKYGDGYFNYMLEGFNQGGLVGGYNQGGLVGSSITPIIESKNESGEMELIQNLSQSVDTNRQTLMVMEGQNQVMNIPDQNPNPVALADTPQTAPAELQDTEAPIPFASLLRQSAQRYLNLGNNAMVIS